MQTIRVHISAIAFGAAMLAGCATVQTPTKGDPIEGFNRSVFKFNDKVDQYALKPVAKGYVYITPQPVRDSVTNFFSNIGDVYIAANNLLQLKITDGVEDIMRIVINTTFGVGGLFDVATLAKLPKHDNDLGLTLGHYGVPAGPYLVLPLFGPSTVRDSMGLIVDVKFNPLNYMEPAVRNPLYVLQFVSVRSDLLGATDLLQQAALDKYSFVRDAYTQQRLTRLRGTSDNNAPLPNYDDQSGSGAAAPAAGAPAAGALPNYADPGDAAQAPNAASGAATTAPSDLPNYSDPGDAPASGAAGATPGMPAPATAPAGASDTAAPAPQPAAAPADSKQPAAAPATQ